MATAYQNVLEDAYSYLRSFKNNNLEHFIALKGINMSIQFNTVLNAQ